MLKLKKEIEVPTPELSVSEEQLKSLVLLRIIIRRISDMEAQIKKKRVMEKSLYHKDVLKTELEFLEELQQLVLKRTETREVLIATGLTVPVIDGFEKESLEGFKTYEFIT